MAHRLLIRVVELIEVQNWVWWFTCLAGSCALATGKFAINIRACKNDFPTVFLDGKLPRICWLNLIRMSVVYHRNLRGQNYPALLFKSMIKVTRPKSVRRLYLLSLNIGMPVAKCGGGTVWGIAFGVCPNFGCRPIFLSMYMAHTV